MSIVGWTLLILLAAGIALILRKVGPPGDSGARRPPAARGCCNVPPEVPGAPPVRRRLDR